MNDYWFNSVIFCLLQGVSTGTSYQLQLVFQKQAKINKLIESIGGTDSLVFMIQ